jgi:hypothetical protein
MYVQYRYKGKFVSAQTASRLGNLKTSKQHLITEIRTKASGMPYTSKEGYVKKAAIPVLVEKEKVLRELRKRVKDKEAQLKRAASRERDRYLGGPEKREQPRWDDYIPGRPLRHEDDLLDDYFDEAVEVADIEGDIYEEDKMPTTIPQLHLIFQKIVELEDYGLTEEDFEEKRVFCTEGQSDVYNIVRIGLDRFAENTLDIIKVSFPVGATGNKDAIRRSILRHIAERKTYDKKWRYFYVIAQFETPGKRPFFRTIIPRTELTVQFRDLRHRNKRNR